MVTCVEPCVLDELIELMPAMVENWFSSGVATPDAIVSGSAPGREADTTMVGKSTAGSSLTGSEEYPNRPKITNPAMSRMVMTGRRMKVSEIFIARRRPYGRAPPSCP